jgi:hypothetical protein
MAIYLVALLVAVGGAGLLAVSTQRSQVTRQVAGLSETLQFQELADAAFREVAAEAVVGQTLKGGEAREKFLNSLRNGVNTGGVVAGADYPILIEAQMVQENLGTGGKWTLSPVAMHLVEYEPFTGYGMLRFSVQVSLTTGKRPRSEDFVQDFHFRAYDPGNGDGFALVVARKPFARINH